MKDHPRMNVTRKTGAKWRSSCESSILSLTLSCRGVAPGLTLFGSTIAR